MITKQDLKQTVPEEVAERFIPILQKLFIELGVKEVNYNHDGVDFFYKDMTIRITIKPLKP